MGKPYPKKGISVDGGCVPNPGGLLEFNGVDLETGEVVFDYTTKTTTGTNNVSEFLAIATAIKYLIENKDGVGAIYSDSMTAIAWIRHKHCRTTYRNKPMMKIVRNVEKYLKSNKDAVKRIDVAHWKKKLWGEPPSDYGRK